jgi:hypothetical protein
MNAAFDADFSRLAQKEEAPATDFQMQFFLVFLHFFLEKSKNLC